MLSDIYADCFKVAFKAECCYAECPYAECRGTPLAVGLKLVDESEKRLLYYDFSDYNCSTFGALNCMTFYVSIL
jgi:hypothetical protein